MRWNTHTNLVHSKLSRIVGILARLRYFLPKEIKLLLYNSRFASTLTHRYLVWGTTTDTNLSKINRLQKKVVRIISNEPYDAHTKPIFDDLRLQPVPNLFNTLLLKRYHACRKNNDPFLEKLVTLAPLAKTYSTRSSHIWKLPYTRTMAAKCWCTCCHKLLTPPLTRATNLFNSVCIITEVMIYTCNFVAEILVSPKCTWFYLEPYFLFTLF